MIELRIDGEDFSLTERALERVAAGLVDMRSYWPLLAPRFLEWMREQFDTEGRFAGDPWQPLSADYAAYKMQRYGSSKGILVAEGDLRRAALTPSRIQTPRTVTFIIDKWGDIAGDSRLDPSWHQDGTDRMPARPILFGGEDLPERVRMDIDETATEYVHDLVRRLGARL